MSAYDQAVSAIDAANREDPNRTMDGEPLALAHGRLAVEWALTLRPSASEALLLAARAHHLRRFDVPRSSYPEGRAGYLRWRRDQKERHAAEVVAILAEAGYDQPARERVAELVRRSGLGSDADTQVVEDSACLAMLETQWDDLVARLEPARLADVVRKTLAKMSPEAQALGAGLRPELVEISATESTRRSRPSDERPSSAD